MTRSRIHGLCTSWRKIMATSVHFLAIMAYCVGVPLLDTTELLLEVVKGNIKHNGSHILLTKSCYSAKNTLQQPEFPQHCEN